MTTTLADRLLAADDEFTLRCNASTVADLNAARLAALAYAAAWHEVNGAGLRADEADALVRARADLAAMTTERDEAVAHGRAVYDLARSDERKAWQDATGCDTPADVRAVEREVMSGSPGSLADAARHLRRFLTAESEQTRRLGDGNRDLHVLLGMRLGDGAIIDKVREVTARAEAAEREVARLTGAGAATDCPTPDQAEALISAQYDLTGKVAAERGSDGNWYGWGEWCRVNPNARSIQVEAMRRAIVGLAHGRAASPPPDASGPASDAELTALWSKTGGSVTASNRALYNHGVAYGRAKAATVPVGVAPDMDRVNMISALHAAAFDHGVACGRGKDPTEHQRREGDALDKLMAAFAYPAAKMPAGDTEDRAVEAFRCGWVEGVESVGTDGAALDRAVAAYFPEVTKVPAKPPPDASDEEIAQQIHEYLDADYDASMSWTVTAERHRNDMAAAVSKLIRPRLDALRDCSAADLLATVTSLYETRGGLIERLATAEQQRDALAANLAEAEEACRLHEKERDVAVSERDDAAALWFGRGMRLRAAREMGPPTPSPRYVAVKRDEVNGRPASWFHTEAEAERYVALCNDNPDLFGADDEIEGALESYTHAVVDTRPEGP